MAEDLFEKLQPLQRAYLAAYMDTANLRRAAEVAQVGRQEHYYWLQRASNKEDYQAAFAEAKLRAGDVLEAEAIRRAHDGIVEPIYQGGQHVGDKLVYSDRLLEFLLKGAMPDRYKDRVQQDLTVSGASELEIKLAARMSKRTVTVDVPKELPEGE